MSSDAKDKDKGSKRKIGQVEGEKTDKDKITDDVAGYLPILVNPDGTPEVLAALQITADDACMVAFDSVAAEDNTSVDEKQVAALRNNSNMSVASKMQHLSDMMSDEVNARFVYAVLKVGNDSKRRKVAQGAKSASSSSSSSSSSN